MQVSPNWSGYGITGGPFTQASGIFTVPGLGTGAKCTSELSEWVGLDGMSAPSLPADPSLIQAGISEFAIGPVTGKCTPQRPFAFSWWEIVPSPPEPIATVSVHPGDRVEVLIRRSRGANWSILLADLSDGQRFTSEHAYDGHGSSAEWILEAPTSSVRCGAGEDPWTVVGLCPLSPYWPVASFMDMGVTGPARALWPIAMVQDRQQVATPSTLFSGDFGVTYTGPLTG
jgi:hypothetical protein